MQKKPNLFRTAVVLGAGFVLGAIALHDPSHSEAQAADDLYDQLIGDGSSVIAVPLQISRESYGLAMVDTKNKTLWIYEIATRKPGFNQLRLMAARSWQYDSQLKEFNSGEPSPEYIKKFLESAKMPQKAKPDAASPKLDVELPKENK